MNSAPKPADQYDVPPRTPRNTTGPQHPRGPYWYTVDPSEYCRPCEECIIKDAQYRVTFERLDTIFTIENLREIFLVTFFVEFFWNVLSSPRSSATFQGIMADASAASTSTFRLIITYPLSSGLWCFTSIFRQAILLFKDCVSVVPALLRIALRLSEAYLLYYVWPVLVAVFWVYPLKKLQAFWGTTTRTRPQTAPRSAPGFEFDHRDMLREAVIQELLRQRLAEARAEEEERRSRKGAGGKRSKKQNRRGRV